MKSQEEEHSFEQAWQKAFDDASMMPPDELWGKIEEQLDEKKRRGGFFFFINSRYLASGVAAMLILVAGWYFFPSINNSNPTVSQQQEQVSTQASVADNTQKAITQSESGVQEKSVLKENIQVKIADKIALNQPIRTKNSNNKNQTQTNENILAASPVVASRSMFIPDNQLVISTLANDTYSSTTKIAEAQSQQATPTLPEAANIELMALKNKEFHQYGNRFVQNKRNIFYMPADFDEEHEDMIAKNDSRTWVGFSSGLSPFDANLKVNNFETLAKGLADKSAMNSFEIPNSITQGNNNTGNTGGTIATAGDEIVKAIPNNSPVNQMKNGRALGFGFSVGKQLRKKWSIETGLRYLNGSSAVSSNVYSINNTTGQVNSFIQNYLQNSGSGNENTIISVSDNYQSNYEYFSVPIQLNYQIPLNKSFKIEVLGGFSSDLFLRNVFRNQENKASYNASNSLYKTFNISGIGSIRAAYKLSEHWHTNLGFIGQQILNSGLNATNASFKPRMLGIGYGLNYMF